MTMTCSSACNMHAVFYSCDNVSCMERERDEERWSWHAYPKQEVLGLLARVSPERLHARRTAQGTAPARCGRHSAC